jgi:hypothetical protein
MAQNGHDLEKDLEQLDPVGIDTNNAAPRNETVSSPAHSDSSDSIYDGDGADKHYDNEKHPEKGEPISRPVLSRYHTNATGITDISQTTEATEAPKRSLWKRINPLKRHPPPVPEERSQSREYTAGFFSLLSFQWITPLMKVCYSPNHALVLPLIE